MKVCFFGTYEKNYPSNRIIIKGLKKNGIDIVECHISLWEKYRNKHGNFLKLFSMFKLAVGLVAAYTRLCFMFFSKCKNVDVIIVGYIGQLDIFFLKALLLFKKISLKYYSLLLYLSTTRQLLIEVFPAGIIYLLSSYSILINFLSK
ncbi:MAG: hypothetical protein KAS78_04490 [Candidatus Pacebacteria bacterium]|nr:hypothetical protein [Candidatus Paceibacterota bacterium]